MKVYRDLVEDGVLVSKEIFDIEECTYTGKDMGERSITATIYFATPIDFQIGDYIKLPMQNLIRSTSGVNGSIASGSGEVEKFYIYTMPTMKKVARAMENGKAFEHTVTFYPAQYELSCVQMRDLGNSMNADSVIYTGFDNVTFNGAAHELMERIMMVLKEAYHDPEGNPLWSYEISDTVNEDVNLALERFPISFSGNTVMDALLELNNKETINTTFFINNRKIYVGFKRPYFCRVTDGMSIDTDPSSQLFTFQYGKTSDKGVALQHGSLCDITKTVGKEVPITKLFAYGASRNLNRYYCSDRVKGGRYVNRLMLPSFDSDGKTDFIVSEDALQRYGVREATKQFEEIYPSIRYATYGDIRQVKYCIKVKASGVKNENIDNPSYPVARIQCYKIVESEIAGVNKLVEAAPPDDLAVYIHAMDKVVKVVLYGGATDAEAISKQRQHDTKVPTYTSGGSDYIPGACFIVHDRGFDEAGTVYENANRSAWFTSIDSLSGFTEKQKEEIKLNQINYTDTFWLTDLYIFQEYKQAYFSRDGYSAWSWARLNSKYTSLQGSIASDSVVVNEIVHVEPITISDTNMTADGIDKRQSTFDIYLRDLGFTINEQNDFGDMVFLQNGTVKVSILDGLLAGQEFEISGSINSTSPSCICAFNDDGTRNEAFFEEPDYTQDGANPQTPYDAFDKGAIWRIRLNRTNVDEADYSNLNLAMPTKEINAKAGDHLVLLDIFMPDIYIHAAENRLLREARKYLEANDNGSISYAVNFDKVRMQQIPNYAMQLREGLNLRVVDEDLNIKTENNGRYIADYRDNKVFSSTESDHNRVWLSANTPIDFTRGKYYTIEFEMYDDSSFDTSATNAFALLKTKNDATIAFNPTYSVNKEYLDNGKIAVTIKFNLPDNFDDSSIYYPSLLLVSEISSNMRMYSHWLSYVFERDFDENTNILNYADFTIDSLTVKITDNSGNNEPIREITATLSEQTNATAWATLMNRVATTAKEGAQNKKALEEVVNTARRNYQALLSLKDSIFDPDGSCDQVFLQVMMQQVGADSMNYQLDNTRSGLSSDGQPTLFNCSCERDSDGYYHFKVYNDDTLRHYVYTQGSQAGNWEIPVGTGLDVQLNGTDSYFVCLKCPKNDTVGQWICSTKQYAVNDPEDDTCWFFNWAILTVDSGGVYTLMETRGNAYMYGDNLVCGKISSLARNSYFDLTSGDFVLGDGTGPALEYINGVLTIRGSKGDAEETLARLGIIEDDVSNALSTVEQSVYANIYNGGDISVSTDGKEIELKDAFIQLATLGCYVKFTKVRETPLSPFSKSCIIAVKKGTYVSHIYLHKDNIYAYLNWGDEYTPTEECDFYVVLAEKEYIRDYLIPGAFDFIEYDMREVWTISGINVIVRTSDAIQSAMQAIANEEDARTEALAEAVSNINGGIDELQKQIDGEVSSYFYDTAPIDEDETILTDIPPFNEWAENYNLQNGVYALKTGARNEFVNHIGDTYTNMEEYKVDDQGNTTTPLAGLSWRWCDATTVNPLPSKYITIRYSQNGSVVEKKLHWHKIADSDAVKALQEAGRAQATADGKSTIFTTQPSNYSVGDMWILMEDTRVGGTLYQKGTVLNANNDSVVFNYAHWSEDVKYIDESVAAKKAQEALDNLELGGTNLLTGSRTGEGWSAYTSFEDGVYYSENNTSGEKYIYSPKNLKLSKGTYTLSFDFKTDGFKEYSGGNNEGVQLFFLDGDFSPMNNHRIQYADISTNWKHYIWTFEVEEDCSGDAYIRFDNDRTSSYTNPTKLWVKDVKLEKGNKATGWSPAPEDVDSKADTIRAIADEAKGDADAALQNLSDMSSDSILTPQEKGSVANEWACIQKEYQQNTTNATSIGMLSDTAYTTYKDKYDALATYVSGLALSTKSNTTIVQSTFQSKFSEYYSANVAFLNALADKVAKLEVYKVEIGGRNLLRYTDQSMYFSKFTAWQSSLIDLVDGWIKVEQKATATTSGVITDKNSDVSLLEKQKSYILSFDAYLDDSATTDTLILNYNYLMSSGGNFAINKSVNITKKPARYSIEFTYNGTTTQNFGAMVGASKSSCPIFYVKNIKLERGNKPTAWSPAQEDTDAAIAAVESKAEALGYLTEVLEDSKNTTDITGGLVMTNVLMLKDLANAGGSVGAGMSGISADNIFMWCGGTYEDAVHAKDNDFEKLNGSDITTLLKKDGTGKIGIFKISETQAVVNVPNQGKIIIDASTANGGIRLYDNNDAEKIVITPKSIKNHKSGTAVFTISDSLTIASTTVNSSSYTASSDGFSVVYDQNSIKISYNVSAYFYFRNIGTSYASATIEIKLQKSTNGTTWQDVKTIETTSGSRNIDFANESNPYFYLSLNNSKEINNVGWSNNYRIVASFRETTSNNHYIKINNGSASVSGECSDESYSKTIIFSDGLLTEKALQSFKVDNSGTAQKIFAKGLSNRKGTAGSGELYVSDSFLNNFKDFLDELNSIFEDVRFVGNNKEYALNIAAKISTLKASIDESAIIASS